jgi:subtilisin family serine protease
VKKNSRINYIAAFFIFFLTISLFLISPTKAQAPVVIGNPVNIDLKWTPNSSFRRLKPRLAYSVDAILAVLNASLVPDANRNGRPGEEEDVKLWLNNYFLSPIKINDKYNLVYRNTVGDRVKTERLLNDGYICGKDVVKFYFLPPISTLSSEKQKDLIEEAVLKVQARIDGLSGAEAQTVLFPQPKGSTPTNDETSWGHSSVYNIIDFPDYLTTIIPSSVTTRVAVVDTGVNDIKKFNIAEKYIPSDPFAAGADFSGNFVPGHESEKPIDDGDHGTPISSIIAGTEYITPSGDVLKIGVAEGTAIVPIKACKVNSCEIPASVAGVCHAATTFWQNDKERNVAHIINLSFGGVLDSTILLGAILDAIHAGSLVVTAAGNKGTVASMAYPNAPMYPAAFSGTLCNSNRIFSSACRDGLISVGATKNNGTISVGTVKNGDSIADFSVTNQNIDLSAPGQNVIAYKSDNSGFMSYDGTSFATAYVSGAAALLIAKHIDMHSGGFGPDSYPLPTPAQLEEWLVNGAYRPLSSSGTFGAWCPTGGCGAGILNIPHAVSQVK